MGADLPGRGPGNAGRSRHVLVVGGGVTGLAAAYFLSQAPSRPRVTVVEGSSGIGGKLRLGEVAGIGVDLGAESLLVRRPEARELIEAIGLGHEIVHPVTTSAKIFSRGRLRPLPTGQVVGVPSDLRGLAVSGLISRRGLARSALDLALPPTRIGSDLSVGRFVAARLGKEVVDRLVEPVLGGVYAGRTANLSLAATMPELFQAVAHHRSALRAARSVRSKGDALGGPVFAGLPGGVGRLPAAILQASGAELRVGAPARALRRTPTAWEVTIGSTHSAETIQADAMILAVPARPAARLLTDNVPVAARELATIDYASVAIVSLAYPRTAFAAEPAGSGFLVPPVEERIAKAATISSAKWQWVAAADPGTIIIRVSVGRYGDETDLQRDDEELVAGAAGDLVDMLGLRDKPIDAVVTRWGGGLPQYTVGHVDRVRRIRAAVAEVPGLAVCGAAYDGIGVPACIASARMAVDAVLGGPSN